MEKENKTVRFNAMQSTILFGGLFIVFVVVSFIPFINMLLILVWLVEIVLWLVLIIKAF